VNDLELLRREKSGFHQEYFVQIQKHFQASETMHRPTLTGKTPLSGRIWYIFVLWVPWCKNKKGCHKSSLLILYIDFIFIELQQ
jgi:hypothetical protein